MAEVTIQQIFDNFLELYYSDESTPEGVSAGKILKNFTQEINKNFPQQGKQKTTQIEGAVFLLECFGEISSILKKNYLYNAINVDDFFENLERELLDDTSIILRPDFEISQDMIQETRGEKRKRDDGIDLIDSSFGFESTPVSGQVQIVTTDLVGPDASMGLSRDEFAKREEDEGALDYRVIQNDRTLENLKLLLSVKNIFGNQLPKMPKDYIARLVFDRKHRSLIGFKGGRVIAGIAFRPFWENMFAEIAFLAVSGNEQVKGYGTRLMNHLKSYCQSVHIYRFLTYADNFAIGYFKKQGFAKDVTLDEDKFRGYIKDYDGGTLMECVLRPGINYLEVTQMVKRQKAFVLEKMKSVSNSIRTFPGIDVKKCKTYKDIPGLIDCWKPKLNEEQQQDLISKLKGVYETIVNSEDAWPFTEPVDRDEVPDYYRIIKEPIDLTLIGKRLEKRFYRTREIFIADFRRMFDNCRTYNAQNSEYYRTANILESTFKEEMRKF